MGSELLWRFVDGKAWRIGGDLEEYSARFIEVDRVEVLAVPYGRNLESQPDQLFTPGQLLVIARCAPGNMMHAAHRYYTTRSIRQIQHVEPGRKIFRLLSSCLSAKQ